MRLFISGSRRHLDSDPERDEFHTACCAIGREAARRRHLLIVHTEGRRTADPHVVDGLKEYAVKTKESLLIEVHRMVEEKTPFDQLGPHVTVERISYRVGADDADKDLGFRVGGLATADAVILLGGGDNTALVGHLAEQVGIPVVAVKSFGGSAAHAFDLHMNEYRSASKECIHALHGAWRDEHAAPVLELCERLGESHVYFLSYKHQERDAEATDHVETLLRRARPTVYRDESEIPPGGRLKSVVSERISKTETFMALWSEASATSEWCSWEIEEATRLAAEGPRPRRVILLTLDATPLKEGYENFRQLRGQSRADRETSVEILLKTEGPSTFPDEVS